MDKYLQEALETYEQNVEKTPTFFMDASTMLDIEEYYMSVHREFDAERCLKLALRLHPDNEDVLCQYAFRLKEKNRWAEALKIIKSIEFQGQRNIRFFYFEYILASGDGEKAVAFSDAYMEVETVAEIRNNWWHDTADSLLTYGFFKESLKQISHIPTTYQEYNHVLEIAAYDYFYLGQYTKALEVMSQAVDADPYDEGTWIQLAELQFKSGKYAESVESCDYALAINPESEPAMSSKLISMAQINDDDAFLRTAAEYLPKVPLDGYSRMLVGEAYRRKLEFPKAIDAFREASRLVPIGSEDRKRILMDLAELYLAMNDDDNAERVLTACCVEDSKISDVLTDLAYVFCKKQKYERADDFFCRFLDVENLNEEDYLRFRTKLSDCMCNQVPKTWKKLGRMTIPFTDYMFEVDIVNALYALKEREGIFEHFSRVMEDENEMAWPFLDFGSPGFSKEEYEECLHNVVDLW